MTGGKKSSVNYSLTDSVGQIAPGQFDSAGYTVKAGFQYAYDLQANQFSFSIDDLDIGFGSLVPDVGTTQSNIITITTPSGHGYEILAVEDKPLSIIGTHTTIPDTTCNGNSCTTSVSAPWTNADAYGFGFSAVGVNSSMVATGIGTSNYFADPTFYRPFASVADNIPAQVFMSEDKPVTDRSARITYKVNIPAYQSAGSYQNSINFIAIPKY